MLPRGYRIIVLQACVPHIKDAHRVCELDWLMSKIPRTQPPVFVGSHRTDDFTFSFFLRIRIGLIVFVTA